MKIILVTGLSGSGKSVALNVLEDAGFFCIDNLPVALLDEAISGLRQQGHRRLAVAVDARTSGSLKQLSESLNNIRQAGHEVQVIFLNARDDILIQRYSETRRRHPLSRTAATALTDDSSGQTLAECIALERDLLSDIEHLGLRLDTSEMLPQVLRRWIKDILELEESNLTLLFQSFAFKEGIPLDADLVFDARCLPNPHYVPELKALTGKDQPVIDFLQAQPVVAEMIEDIHGYLKKWLPRHAEESRSYLTVAIGCTGGQHRSVYIAERLRAIFSTDFICAIRHRSLSQRGRA